VVPGHEGERYPGSQGDVAPPRLAEHLVLVGFPSGALGLACRLGLRMGGTVRAPARPYGPQKTGRHRSF
jgi:hypothetical protein